MIGQSVLVGSLLVGGTLDPASTEVEGRWLRSTVDADSSATLELASRRYSPPGSNGPDVWLIGVSHIGDSEFYREVLQLADSTDLVMYESVMPVVTMAPPEGADDEARRAATQAALDWLAAQAGTVREQSGEVLSSMDQLQQRIVTVDRRLVDAVRLLRKDAWGYPVTLVSAHDRMLVRSLGADGIPGGQGAAADLEALVPEEIERAEGDGIQKAMADGLKLDFQLTALPYERKDWVVSDMDWETLEARFSETGVDLGGLSGMLEGTSLPAGIAKALLRILPLLDAVSGGAMTDGAKVMMVELLGREDMITLAMSQLGADAGRILIAERNRVVLDHLARIAADQRSIAIVYGAGHMQDFDERLQNAGYQAVETRWLPAITVDLTNSKLTRLHLAMLRRSVAAAAARIAAESSAASPRDD